MSDVFSILAFLRCCLDESVPLPDNVLMKIDWKEAYRFANEQSLLGLMNRGLERLNHEGRMTEVSPIKRTLDEDLVLDWLIAGKNIQQRNKLMNQKTIEIILFFAQQGFKSCILKGQGNNLLYPDFFSRMPGDIDIWVMGTKWNTFKFVRKKFPNVKCGWQHIEYPVFEDVPVEVHFYPSFLQNPFANYYLRRFFRLYGQAMLQNKVDIPGETECISIPTPFFNSVYQLVHISQHLLTKGIGLRQFVDYYYVLKSLADGERLETVNWLKKMHLMKQCAAVMYIEQDMLGLDSIYLLITPDKKRGRQLWNEILFGGNFGQCNPAFWNIGFWRLQWVKLVRSCRFAGNYPSEGLWEPFTRFVHFICRMWYELRYKTTVVCKI